MAKQLADEANARMGLTRQEANDVIMSSITAQVRQDAQQEAASDRWERIKRGLPEAPQLSGDWEVVEDVIVRGAIGTRTAGQVFRLGDVVRDQYGFEARLVAAWLDGRAGVVKVDGGLSQRIVYASAFGLMVERSPDPKNTTMREHDHETASGTGEAMS